MFDDLGFRHIGEAQTVEGGSEPHRVVVHLGLPFHPQAEFVPIPLELPGEQAAICRQTHVDAVMRGKGSPLAILGSAAACVSRSVRRDRPEAARGCRACVGERSRPRREPRMRHRHPAGPRSAGRHAAARGWGG